MRRHETVTLSSLTGHPVEHVPDSSARPRWLRRSVVIGVAVALAAGLGVAFAYFTSTGSGTGSASVGTLQMTNSDNGTYIVNFTGEYPNFSSSGTLTLTNSGTVPASSMTLTIGTPTNKTCASNGLTCATGVGTSTDLSGEATIAVVDNTTGTTVLAATTIDSAVSHGPYSLGGTGGGATWQPGEAHSFTVTLSVPQSAGNTYQGTSTSFPATFNGTVG